MREHGLESGDSMIHRLDPGIRIVSAVCISIAAAVSEHIGVIVCYLVGSILLCAMARIGVVQGVARLKPATWFLVMLWVFLPLTFTKEIIVQYGWIHISMDGILLASRISLKACTILLIFSALIVTIPVSALGAALHRLKVPDKMVFLLLMSYRYIAVIQDEYQRLLRAARFRGFIPGTNLHSYKTYAYLSGMLFVRASLRAKRVYKAMRCRGFKGQFRSLDSYAPNGLNLVFLGIMVAISLGLTLLERGWMT